MRRKKTMANNNPFKIHVKDENGNFTTSGFSSDPNNKFGRFVSVGNEDTHTTFVYNSNGRIIDIKVDGKSVKPS
jgi:hypothetical protein